MPDITRIVVLGGGYAGVEAVKVLHRAFRKDPSVDITLVDYNPFHALMTELHEVAAAGSSRRACRSASTRSSAANG